MRLVPALVLAILGFAEALPAQSSPLLARSRFRAIREESSGELALTHFRHIIGRYSGFTPSRGGDQLADYLATQARANGLEDVTVEGFPADGRSFFWTFLTEPSWDGESGTLTLLEPRRELLADFRVHPVVLGRFSSSADLTAELVDVGAGVSPADYQGKTVRGRIVLASGEPGAAHALAVWGHGAAGLVWYRAGDAREPLPLVANPTLLPWVGPAGEPPAFAFGISSTKAAELKALLHDETPLRVRATVQATTGPGEYRQVSGIIRGTEPALDEVWVNAHDNFRNTGGANNLTGVGATLEMARVLATLVAQGSLPRPRRTIRFLWGAEHYASNYNLFRHPEKVNRILAFLNVDMVGYHQERAKSVFNLYRVPHSRPHFSSDVAEELIHAVGRANTVSVRQAGLSGMGAGGIGDRYDPFYAPTGSRDQLHYRVDEFWGPSDHEDVLALGIPAVLYNDWPAPYLGTQEDNIDRVDPTQMRRAIVTIAATAYTLAAVAPREVATLVPIVASYAQARLASAARHAAAAANPGESFLQLTEATVRERRTLESLQSLDPDASGRDAIARAQRQLDQISAANLAAAGLATYQPQLSADERRLAAIVPSRVDSINGPVHFFRPEYGVAWLRAKTGGVEPRTRVRLAARGHYLLYEALNFADGRRSLLEIGNAVSAEYGSVALDQLEEYFGFLEQVGVVRIGRRGSR